MDFLVNAHIVHRVPSIGLIIENKLDRNAGNENF
jgi:hypothetical protein